MKKSPVTKIEVFGKNLIIKEQEASAWDQGGYEETHKVTDENLVKRPLWGHTLNAL